MDANGNTVFLRLGLLAAAAVVELLGLAAAGQWLRSFAGPVGFAGFIAILAGGIAGGAGICELGHACVAGHEEPWFSRPYGWVYLIVLLGMGAVMMTVAVGVALHPFGLAGTGLHWAQAAEAFGAALFTTAIWRPQARRGRSDTPHEPWPPYTPPRYDPPPTPRPTPRFRPIDDFFEPRR